jgi:hypothetical protein
VKCIFEVSLTFSLHYAKSHLFFECSFSVFQFFSFSVFVELCGNLFGYPILLETTCSHIKMDCVKEKSQSTVIVRKKQNTQKNTFSSFKILFWIVQAWEDAFTDYYWKKLTFWNAIGGKLIRASLVRDF